MTHVWYHHTKYYIQNYIITNLLSCKWSVMVYIEYISHFDSIMLIIILILKLHYYYLHATSEIMILYRNYRVTFNEIKIYIYITITTLFAFICIYIIAGAFSSIRLPSFVNHKKTSRDVTDQYNCKIFSSISYLVNSELPTASPTSG